MECESRSNSPFRWLKPKHNPLSRNALPHQLELQRYVLWCILQGVEFEWDDANLDHIALHGVEPEECEDAFINPGRQPFNTYSTANETRFGSVREKRQYRR